MEKADQNAPRWIRLSVQDDVAVALADLTSGETISMAGSDVVLRSDVPFGHKFALRDIGKGQHVIKYGEVIGVAGTHIPAGEHVHVHNLWSMRARG